MKLPAVLMKQRWAVGYRFGYQGTWTWLPEFNATKEEAFAVQTNLSKDFASIEMEWVLVEQTGEWQ